MLRSPAVPEVSLRDRRQALLARTSLRGAAFCRTYAAEADDWLSDLAERASAGNHRHLALVAVGGYGRGELCPFSDLDVALVHDGRRDVADVADAIWYPVWDQGVRLDHSVRRPQEVLEAASDDLRVALGLLDGRLVWGDERVADPLLQRAAELWRDRLGAHWLPTLLEQMDERQRSQGEVAFLLEPELKESHGGLRDVNVLRALHAFAPALAEYIDLSALQQAAVLIEARVELHRSAGRELDRLLLQEQDEVAAALEYPDADALMAAVAAAGRAIAWACDDVRRRRRFWQPERPRRRGLFGRARSSGRGARAEPVTAASHAPEAAGQPGLPGDDAPVEVEPGIVVLNEDEAALSASAAETSDSSLPLRLAAVAAEREIPISRGALYRLADKTPPPTDPWPVETRQALVRVLSTGRPGVDAMESLDQVDLLSRLLPEWSAVRNKPQRNAYHRYTVDRHLLEAAANAAELTERVERPDLLLVGTLLHDIGKGYPGDHTEVGMELIGRIGRRMGFPPGDVDTLVTMCRLHLLLPDVATRRDLSDPATVDAVAAAVGGTGTLQLLASLTEADSLATGPSAWGTWKAGLVAELVAQVRTKLEGGQAPSGLGWVTETHRVLMADVRGGGRPSVQLDPPRVIVAAPDRRGLLASVAGTLALHGLDVRSADATGEEGVAIEIFTVEVGRGSWPDAARLREDLEAVLSDRLALDDRLAAKAHDYARRGPTAARPTSLQVEVENDASASSTIVEIRAPDEVGLLHRVTRALFDCDLNVVSARVSTIGSEVVDAFYVRDASGAKVTDPAALQKLTEQVGAAISIDAPPAGAASQAGASSAQRVEDGAPATARPPDRPAGGRRT